MKHLTLLITLLILTTSSIARDSSSKSYKIIKHKIEEYQNWRIDQTNYSLSEEDLRQFSIDYFEKRGYLLHEETLETLSFLKIKPIRRSYSSFYTTRVRTEPQTQTTSYGTTFCTHITKPVVKEKRHTSYHWKTTTIKIHREKYPNGYKIKLQKMGASDDAHAYQGINFKKELYVYLYGNELAIPTSLASQIEEHNKDARKRHQIKFNKTN